MKSTDNNEIMKELLTTEPPGAYITTQDTIRLIIGFDPLSYYVPMGEQAHLFYDYISLGVTKNSESKEYLDQM